MVQEAETESLHTSHLAPRRGAAIPVCLTGGLRFATTTRYFLATLWVASSHFKLEFTNDKKWKMLLHTSITDTTGVISPFGISAGQ